MSLQLFLYNVRHEHALLNYILDTKFPGEDSLDCCCTAHSAKDCIQTGDTACLHEQCSIS